MSAKTATTAKTFEEWLRRDSDNNGGDGDGQGGGDEDDGNGGDNGNNSDSRRHAPRPSRPQACKRAMQLQSTSS